MNPDINTHTLESCRDLFNNQNLKSKERVSSEYSKLVYTTSSMQLPFIIKRYEFKNKNCKKHFVEHQFSPFLKIWAYNYKIINNKNELYIILENIYDFRTASQVDWKKFAYDIILCRQQINSILENKNRFYTFSCWNKGNFMYKESKLHLVDESNLIWIDKTHDQHKPNAEIGFYLENIFAGAAEIVRDNFDLNYNHNGSLALSKKG